MASKSAQRRTIINHCKLLVAALPSAKPQNVLCLNHANRPIGLSRTTACCHRRLQRVTSDGFSDYFSALRFNAARQ